jgi:hypothetical protein
MDQAATSGRSAIRKLRKFVTGPVERCDFCRTRLADEHPHLVETHTLRLLCACIGCSTDMAADGMGYRAVERRQETLMDFVLEDADWLSLQIPIDVAFLFRPDGEEAPIALFPGPAGATRSQLSSEAWLALTAKYSLLNELSPATEALLINRAGGKRDHYRVSTDHCYALTGLLRTRWRGLTGGAEAWAAIDSYFADLAQTIERSPVHA